MSSRYLGELTLTSVHLSQSHSWFVGSRHPDRKFLERASGKGADFAPAENKSHKHAVRHILSGSFLRRYHYWRSFDPMTLFSPTFDGGQAKVRLNNAKFSIYTFFKLPPKVFFAYKAHLSCSEIPQYSKYSISVILRGVVPPKVVSQKIRSYLFRYIVQIPFCMEHWLRLWQSSLVQSKHKVA